ncbi:cytochrome P450 [Cystobasidium minutum MCA 4210]|uniref:cytochrome P450 n=1 Tax=Cystobasidium minutum MCA 4210 TaxID=1397322 RepID=UPI0034CE9C1D|eukprot:jgi/Rhomi1/61649/CE61648_5299
MNPIKLNVSNQHYLHYQIFFSFIVMASDNALTRKILNSPNHTEPCLVASAKEILIPTNWVFLTGKVHADYRKSLNVLFTRKALSIYLKVQETIYKSAFEKWLVSTKDGAKPHMMECRNLNMDTSLRVFCGTYLPDEAAKEISDKYWDMTRALELVNFPFAFPGTKVYKAIQARKRVMHWFMHCSAESKKRMAAGEEPDCLIDAWIKAMIEAKNANETSATGEKALLNREYSDHEIAMVLLSFLFASQDAMTSGLIYAFQYMSDYPEVFAKVRQEQLELRGDSEVPITLDILDESPYLRAFVKEVLRLRPPVIMVPYSAKKAFPIEENYTVPKGSIVIPSFWNSLHDADVYADPDTFMPERWLPGGVSEKSNPANYLVFGSGPHKCIAYDYAVMHIAAVIGSAALRLDWRHERTPKSDEIKIIATIFPEDDCLLQFTPADISVA